jgi:hypothetical protein
MILFCVGVMYSGEYDVCDVTLSQWRNVISGGPRFKIFEGLASISAKGTSRPPYMHEFFRGSRACSPGKYLNLESLKCHFLDFGERFYRILMVRKRHCNISETLANVFALQPEPGRPHLVGGPRVLPVRAHSSYATALSVYPHRASLENMFGDGGNRTYDLVRPLFNNLY